MLNRSDLQLTELASIGVGQVVQEVLHVLLGHLLQVDQVGEAVELLQSLLCLLRYLGGLDIVEGWRLSRTVSRIDLSDGSLPFHRRTNG